MRVWESGKEEFGIKDNFLVLTNVPYYRIVYYTKMEETKRKRFDDEVKKKKKRR